MFALLSLGLIAAAAAAPLDDYVWRPDSNYGWTDLGDTYTMRGCNLIKTNCWTGYVLNMTSQKWLNDEDYSPDSRTKSIWYHTLVVIVPDKLRHYRNASLWITGGGINDIPSADSEDIVLSAALAMETGTVIGALFQIPCQPIKFASDAIQKSRSEDAIIAFTWDHFMRDTSNPEWLVRFPMVKASVRAMDAVTEFTTSKFPETFGVTPIEKFVVSGASKRGWTTWLVGAVDPARVSLIIPIVLDAINFVNVEHHQWKSYHGWSFALIDYFEMDITARFDSPEMLMLSKLEDPFFFRERLTMPKLVVNAFLDEFQQPDDTHYWWNDMPEPKHFLMTYNSEHSEITGILEIVPDLCTWVNYHLNKWQVPTFTWEISNTTGEIVATLDDVGTVHQARAFYGYSCGNNVEFGKLVKRRDFRIANTDAPCNCGIGGPVVGYCANLQSFERHVDLVASIENGKRVYRAKFDAPEDGRWVGFFIDIQYERHPLFPHANALLADSVEHKEKKGFLPTDLPGRLEFTTEVSVWPNTFPYHDCHGEGCRGTLL